MRFVSILLAMLAAPQTAPSSTSAQWIAGAEDCARNAGPTLQIQSYDPQTYFIRQSPCSDFEAPFIYLLIGSEKALLIDTGAVEDATEMPIAASVLELLPKVADTSMPLLVAHTHAHRDHFAGDAQFAGQPNVQVIDPELESVQAFFGFERWPEGTASVDLGERTITVLPAPGHHAAHVVFYDERAQLLFTGDFLLPGRLLIEDVDAYRQTAHRIAEYFRDRPIAHVLGAHIEMDKDGNLYTHGAEHHPNERPIELSKADLLNLPAAADAFNGFYATHPSYVLSNPKRNALFLLLVAILGLAGVVWCVRTFVRRHRARSA